MNDDLLPGDLVQLYQSCGMWPELSSPTLDERHYFTSGDSVGEHIEEMQVLVIYSVNPGKGPVLVLVPNLGKCYWTWPVQLFCIAKGEVISRLPQGATRVSTSYYRANRRERAS